jgi:hypothetical protein
LREHTWPDGFIEHGPGLFVSQWDDAYDSSRMLLTDMIYRLPLQGKPVAFVPNRDQLWVTGKNNHAAILLMLETAKEGLQTGHSLSPLLYRLTDGVWASYVPEDSTQHALWISIKRQSDMGAYAQQKEYLDAIHERENIDLFVAPYTLLQHKDQSLFSATIWSPGENALLPKTERIAFDIGQQEIIWVDWDKAYPLVGHLMQQEPGLIGPIRYRVQSFPGQNDLEKLRLAVNEP